MSVRTLVVEDFAPIRRIVCSTVEQSAGVHVIAEAQDGLEAVEKATQLQPDLILMDIGLPSLNGIEAARRILGANPKTKILFVSQEEPSPSMVRAISEMGSVGFVQKLYLYRDLPLALEMALANRRFISGLADASPVSTDFLGHAIQFYSSDDVFTQSLAGFFATALLEGRAAIAMATSAHLEVLAHRLEASGLDVEGATRHGTYVPLKVEELVPRLLSAGRDQFLDGISDFIDDAARKSKTGRASVGGEFSAVMCGQGEVEAGMRIEQTSNKTIQHRSHVDILCACPLPMKPLEDPTFRSMCAEHSTVFVQ
jgi:CheY-like chemotaxis protein